MDRNPFLHRKGHIAEPAVRTEGGNAKEGGDIIITGHGHAGILMTQTVV